MNANAISTVSPLSLALRVACVVLAGACGKSSGANAPGNDSGAHGDASANGGARLPLVLVSDVPLPGNAVRFDYEDVDAANGHLIVAHMNDASVVVVNLVDGSVAKVLPNIPTARGVVVAPDVGRFFVTSSPNQLVIVDSASLTEIARVTTGNGPDGVGWDPVHKIVGVSDQADGAVSLIAGSGTGARTSVKLGGETGNVVFDAGRGVFWAAVVTGGSNEIVAIDPSAASVTTRIPLAGCSGAHGLRIHPDGKSAFVACESNDVVARVELDGAHAVVTAPTGTGPDVLAIDPGLSWLYVASESGDLVVFDVAQPGLVVIDREKPGPNAHSVAVDPSTHRVFFPLMTGPSGKPVLRIMRPSGT